MYKLNILLVFCIFGLIRVCVGQDAPVELEGQCDPNINVVTNFNVAAYLGEWRLIETYPSDFQSGTCNKAQYSAAENGSVIVYNTQVVNQELTSSTGLAVLATDDGRGILSVTFPNIWSWKLSRTNTLTPAAVTAINQIVSSTANDLNATYYNVVDRSDAGCFYYPTPLGTSDGVIFPGQCDPNIPVVTNLSVGAYVGEWRLLESYPSNFQSGTCNKVLYSINYTDPAGSINVLNTQIVNQELTSITGLAFPADDGTGILSVTFPNSSTPQELKILSTDYAIYSIVYSCVNIDSERRRVWSWIFTRLFLTPNAINTINEVVNSIDVLDTRYYQKVDRSDAGCFYYPTPVPGTDVNFPGQCDLNIPVVTNFNATAYLGEWRLIKSYHSSFQSGTCNKAQYSAAENGSVIVYNTQVVNQELTSSTGLAVLATDDGRGILSVTFPDSPTAQELRILATDYTSYALVYSCVNVNSERRRVWSWKLSRTNTLTPEATTAINEVVNSIDVLDDRYYETVDRSNDGCFHHITPVPGADLIFPGQCDRDAPVVSNFNTTAYLGEWRLIESYYSSFQSGTCNKAHYSAGTSQSIIVHNTQVVNQGLASITGSAVPTTTDGRGILTVTFPNSPNPAGLWILATDYTSFSLVYSCVNVDSDRRRVWSWIMSRTNTLTPAATTAINEVVNSVDVLDARYYKTVDRSDAACFYFPTPDPSSVVVFPGQCDRDIPIVKNFNFSEFAGTWYYTERYDPVNNSTCVGSLFTPESHKSYNLTDFEVLNGKVKVSTYGLATVAADGSGKIVIVRPAFGSMILLILAIDYSDYALAYACDNISDDRRQIGVWKLSRGRTMSAAGNTAINAYISGRQELDQRYFNNIPQSEDCLDLSSSSFLFKSSIIVILVSAVFQLVLL